jgi:hypothetical protein
MTVYRRIYEKIKGPIPKDELGRSYDIHHVDGNKKNNNINNLVAVSIQEHYNIHLNQNDWGACLALAKRMKLDYKTISELSSKTNKGKIRSEETKQKISQKNKGRIQSKEEKQYRSQIMTGKPRQRKGNEKSHPSKWKPVYCNELNLSFPSLKETGKQLNLNPVSINNQILGYSKSVKYNKQKLTFKYL